jgi:Ca2+-binding EF-hand superfamily protein
VGFDEFCAACAKRKLQLVAQEQDKNNNSKEENSTEGSGGSKDGVLEILAVLDALELPTRKTAQEIFQRLNTDDSNVISLDSIEQEMLESNPELKRKVEAYKAYGRDGESADDMTADDLHRFLLFLVYYRNLWEEFVFIDDDDLQVSKGEFIPVAESLHLFDDTEVEFSKMDVAGNGHILFEDFCSLCAKKQMSAFGSED